MGINNEIVKGGYPFYGFDIGILMLDATFPRIVGDVGNALTWHFPVLYKVVSGALPQKIVCDLSIEDIGPFIEGALSLQAQGVKAIGTSCGFLAMFQQELAGKLDIPVFTSSLLMLPILINIYGTKKILIVTANSSSLSKRHLDGAAPGVPADRYEIIGTENCPTITKFTVNNWPSFNPKNCENEIIQTIDTVLSSRKEEFGAILLECTNMPPYSDAIRKKFNLPVFDYISMCDFMHSSFGNQSY